MLSANRRAQSVVPRRQSRVAGYSGIEFTWIFLSPAGDERRATAASRRHRLERGRVERVPLQQFVKLGAVALRQLRGLGHIAARDFQEAHEVFALELLARLLERREFGLLMLDGLLHEGG